MGKDCLYSRLYAPDPGSFPRIETWFSVLIGPCTQKKNQEMRPRPKTNLESKPRKTVKMRGSVKGPFFPNTCTFFLWPWQEKQ